MPAKIKFGCIIQDRDEAMAVQTGAAHLGVVFARGPVGRTLAWFQDPNKIARFLEAVFAHSPVT